MVLCKGPAIEPGNLPNLGQQHGQMPTDASGSYHDVVRAFKRDLVRAALVRTNGNQTKAAEVLGLRRTYLSRLLKVLGIREP